MKYLAAIITVSDKGSQGQREDKSGPAIEEVLKKNQLEIAYKNIIPDEKEQIVEELLRCVNKEKCNLIITTGGTGFSKRDITPEATREVIERETPGIPEAMRAESMKVTDRGMLSRATAGIRGNSLIINLPGSPKAVQECLEAVIAPVLHGLDILVGTASDCARK